MNLVQTRCEPGRWPALDMSARAQRQDIAWTPAAGGPVLDTSPRAQRQDVAGTPAAGAPLLAKPSAVQVELLQRLLSSDFPPGGSSPGTAHGHSSLEGCERRFAVRRGQKASLAGRPGKHADPGTRLPQSDIADLMSASQTCSGSFFRKASDLTPGITYFKPKFRY